MKILNLACAALFVFSLTCHAQGPVQNPDPAKQPPPPGVPDVLIDQGIFDIFQGTERRAFENFSIRRKPDGSIVMSGHARYALPIKDGSDIWDYYPEITYGQVGLKEYTGRAEYPIGSGSGKIWFAGAQAMWQFDAPYLGAKEAKVTLPLNGVAIDKNITHSWAIFGLQPGKQRRMMIDTESGRVSEVRVAAPVPSKIETLAGSFLCDRVLVTMGSFAVNLWFDREGRLLRLENPGFGITSIRRGTYGLPSARNVPPPSAVGPPIVQAANFNNGRQFLIGELTLPPGAGPFPTVLLLSDAGPQDRDGNPPMLSFKWNNQRELAWALASHGVACLRLDDPGTGNAPIGVDNPTITDFIGDARASLKWLRTIPAVDKKKIGALGLGEGGLIVMQLASTAEIDFAMLLAAPGTTNDEVFFDQVIAQGARMGVDPNEIEGQVAETKELYALFLNPDIKVWKSPEVPEKFMPLGEMRPQFRDVMRFDPRKLAPLIKCPVFAVHGTADKQISNAQFETLKKAFAGAPNATFESMEGLDHFLMPTINDDLGDATDMDRRVSPEALRIIGEWAGKR